jgi:PAS domain-containing protein
MMDPKPSATESSLHSAQFRQYGAAVLATLTATVARLLLQPFIGFDRPFITYFAAVFVSAWWLGFKPTLLTVLLSGFLADLLFFPPTGAGGLAGGQLNFIGLALFVGVGVGTAYMGKGRLDAQRRAETEAAEAQRLQAVAEEEAALAEEETTRADEESARAQSGNRFFGLSRDLLCTIGFDGYFKDLNPAWEKTLGYTQFELLARPSIEFVHPDDRQATVVEAEKISGSKARSPLRTATVARTAPTDVFYGAPRQSRRIG